MIPYNMNSNGSYECPITGKTFEFTQDKASKREAFSAQQIHTGAEIQRLERLAEKTLSYRELLRAGRMEREQAAAVDAKPKEAPKPAPLSEAIWKTAVPYAC